MAVPDLSRILSVVAEPSRATMLSALLGGVALPAGELARQAGVSAQTASGHLARLAEAGLVVAEVQGRHRYYRLSGEQAATAIEALLALVPPPRARSLRQSQQFDRLRVARSCYDHAAGELGVAIAEALQRQGAIRLEGREYVVTPRGEALLSDAGVVWPPPRKQRRASARACLDWSERRYHIAGALGAAILARLFELGWVVRVPGGRALAISDAGADGLRAAFGVVLQR